jgi:hypothetical protein
MVVGNISFWTKVYSHADERYTRVRKPRRPVYWHIGSAQNSRERNLSF